MNHNLPGQIRTSDRPVPNRVLCQAETGRLGILPKTSAESSGIYPLAALPLDRFAKHAARRQPARGGTVGRERRSRPDNRARGRESSRIWSSEKNKKSEACGSSWKTRLRVFQGAVGGVLCRPRRRQLPHAMSHVGRPLILMTTAPSTRRSSMAPGQGAWRCAIRAGDRRLTAACRTRQSGRKEPTVIISECRRLGSPVQIASTSRTRRTQMRHRPQNQAPCAGKRGRCTLLDSIGRHVSLHSRLVSLLPRASAATSAPRACSVSR
jgi:hypothetical protein